MQIEESKKFLKKSKTEDDFKEFKKGKLYFEIVTSAIYLIFAILIIGAVTNEKV